MIILKVNALKMALAGAIVSAVALFLLPVCGLYVGRGIRVVSFLRDLLPGYTVSWQGAGLGLVYGFVSCFVYMGVFGWVYNELVAFKGIKIKAKAKPASKKKKK